MGRIDIQTGQIVFDDDEMIIYPRMEWRDFERCALHSHIEWQEVMGDWKRCALDPLMVDGVSFRLSLQFKLGRLDLVSMVRSEGPPPSWETWSAESEAQNKQFHDDWLKAHIGVPPHTYAWGRIESAYIRQEATSKILIAFA